MKTVAVIPAYNESTHISSVIQRVSPHVDHVVVVDDGSMDDTYAQAAAFGGNVVALQHTINLGKGAALTTACEAAKRLHGDIIITMDADDQHNPDHIPQFITELQDQQVDIVFGAREFNNAMPFTMIVGNRGLSVIINVLFKMLVHDTQSGYRAFTSTAYDRLKWRSTGYEAETEMIVRASEHQLAYSEIPIDTIYHDNYKGTTMLDGVKIFLQILKWKFI